MFLRKVHFVSLISHSSPIRYVVIRAPPARTTHMPATKPSPWTRDELTDA